MSRKTRKSKLTLIFVGEGEADKAFLSHLRSIYGTGNLRVSPKSAGGKGPENVIRDTISSLENSGYSYAAALLDTDLKWPRNLVQEAKNKNIPLFGSSPCIEGFLLDILQKKKPRSSKECKKVLHPMLKGRETCSQSYKELFNETTLEAARKNIQQLDSIIRLIQGEKPS